MFTKFTKFTVAVQKCQDGRFGGPQRPGPSLHGFWWSLQHERPIPDHQLGAGVADQGD
jgi:hypothetical protein